ncbi:MAG: AbrB/MazE/SpoVT family DNA-binding domain-containing protein [Nanoarchaeota archaeon]
MEINMTKMSSKGQVVIPQELRKDIKEGDKLLVIRNADQIIIKKASKMDKQLAEDLEFAKRTEEAYKRIEAGEYISIDSDKLVEEMSKW